MDAYQSPLMEELTLDPALAQALATYELVLKSCEHGHLQAGADAITALCLPDGRTVYVDRSGTIVGVVG